MPQVWCWLVSWPMTTENPSHDRSTVESHTAGQWTFYLKISNYNTFLICKTELVCCISVRQTLWLLIVGGLPFKECCLKCRVRTPIEVGVRLVGRMTPSSRFSRCFSKQVKSNWNQCDILNTSKKLLGF